MAVGELALPLVFHVVMRARERCPFPFAPFALWQARKLSLPTAALRTAGPVLHPGNTVELTPMMGAWVSWPRGHEHERSGPAPYLSYGGMGKGEKRPHSHSLRPVAGGKAVPEVMRVRELVLPLTSYSTQQRGPYTSPWQHRRAGPRVYMLASQTQEMRAGEPGFSWLFTS